MTARQEQRSIEPGSVPYGDRAGLEQALGQAGAQQSAGPPSQAAPSPVPTADNPLGALLGGAVSPPSEGPLTSGLSVGPGPGPVDEGPMASPQAERLRMIATQAATPSLRAAARRMLRRMDQSGERL